MQLRLIACHRLGGRVEGTPLLDVSSRSLLNQTR
jgi:hypothetical protein